MHRCAALLVVLALLSGCASQRDAPACRGDAFDLNPAGAVR
jgi:hypothetical protein